MTFDRSCDRLSQVEISNFNGCDFFGFYTGNLPINDNDSQNAEYTTSQTQKKSTRGFLRSLLCCLGKDKDKTQTVEQCVDGSQYVATDRMSFLLPPARHQDLQKKCMVIDLDETLVHSSFKVSSAILA